MGLPKDKSARQFYRAGQQRWEDARFLLEAGRALGAVYLAGYCVECLLKALILSQVPAADRGDILKQFRGAKAHEYQWLQDRYYSLGGARFPPAVVQAFEPVAVWGTELRYKPGTLREEDAREFFASAEMIRAWADGRL
jgi:HEPN domain-containing protein